jgi:DNA-binding NarL/FixJ family response regulator
MESQQIILANEPRLLRTMLRSVFEKAPGFQVAGEIGDLKELPEVVGQTDPQWVIVSLWSSGRMPAVIASVLAEHPSVSILGIAPSGSDMVIKHANAPERPLADLTLERLFAVLRDQRPEPVKMFQPTAQQG